MDRRLELQALFEALLGTEEVHFQAPSDSLLNYPCIIYERDHRAVSFANNSPYRHTKRYQVTVIDRDPDSSYPDKVADLPLCNFERHYQADGLHHDVFNLYF